MHAAPTRPPQAPRPTPKASSNVKCFIPRLVGEFRLELGNRGTRAPDLGWRNPGTLPGDYGRAQRARVWAEPGARSWPPWEQLQGGPEPRERPSMGRGGLSAGRPGGQAGASSNGGGRGRPPGASMNGVGTGGQPGASGCIMIRAALQPWRLACTQHWPATCTVRPTSGRRAPPGVGREAAAALAARLAARLAPRNWSLATAGSPVCRPPGCTLLHSSAGC